MKKLILLCILVLSMLGCSSIQTGTSKIVENKNYTKVTDNEVFYIEDLLEILKNPKKITLRVYTADGYFDILFNDKFRNGFIDLLEISLKG